MKYRSRRLFLLLYMTAAEAADVWRVASSYIQHKLPCPGPMGKTTIAAVVFACVKNKNIKKKSKKIKKIVGNILVI